MIHDLCRGQNDVYVASSAVMDQLEPLQRFCLSEDTEVHVGLFTLRDKYKIRTGTVTHPSIHTTE